VRVVEEVRMRWTTATVMMVAIAIQGCLQVAPQPAVPPTTMTSWSPMGGFSMSSGAACAGHALLTNGSATVNDSCFTGADNIVMCTDTTAPNPMRCSPAEGSLSVAGAPGDTISYARVK
jgi:hypothetical protein